MKAAEIRASSAIALCTELTVVSRSLTTDAIDTFISDVSMTRTNMAAASRNGNRRLAGSFRSTATATPSATEGLQPQAREKSGFDHGRRASRARRPGKSVGTTMTLGDCACERVAPSARSPRALAPSPAWGDGAGRPAALYWIRRKASRFDDDEAQRARRRP